MIRAAWRDEIITQEENQVIQKVANLLNVRDFDIPEVTQMPACAASIAVGTRVCFTGTAVDENGKKIGRSDLESIAANAGLQPVPSVTKKNCDLLVAADPSSQSGKAGKARKHGIPILSGWWMEPTPFLYRAWHWQLACSKIDAHKTPRAP